MRAESTLAALNFAPDEFTHRTASTRKSKAGSMRKDSFDDDAKTDRDDLINQAPMFFVSTLPDMGGGDEWPMRKDVERQQQQQPQSAPPRGPPVPF